MTGLFEEYQWLKLVRDESKAYIKLIDHLVKEWAPKDGEEQDFHIINTVKYHAGCIGEKPAIVNKWFREIYIDIFDLNDKRPELFVNPGEHLCSFYYYMKPAGFLFHLGVFETPRVGDHFTFFFVKAITTIRDFVVKEVDHEYSGGKMEIEVYLRPYGYSV